MSPWSLGPIVVTACVACGAPWDAAGQPADAPSASRKVLRIPLEGLFGEDFDADGVKDALQFARRQKCSEVVFDINSSGGRVDCARKIAALMDQYDDSLKYHAVVTRAIGAPLWVLVGCDSVYIADGAEGTLIGAGAMVAPEKSADKPDAAPGDDLAAAAAKKGVTSPALVRALIDPGARLFLWHNPDSSGEELFDGPPDRSKFPGAAEVDSAATVLTLDGPRALELGVAGTAGAFRAASESWQEPSEYGTAAMRKNGEKVRAAQKKLGEARDGVAEVDRLLATARATKTADEFTDYATQTVPDPKGHGTVQVETPEALVLWAQRDIAYREAWFNVGHAAKDVLPLLRELHSSPDLEPGVEARIKGILREAEKKFER